MTASYRLTMLFGAFCLALAACGGSGGGGGGGGLGPPAPVANQAVGGAWTGTDGDGNQVFALSTEGGQLHWVVPATGEQGFGTATSDGNDVTINYTYVAPFGFTLLDGSTSADCTATGTIQERQSLSADISCDTSNGGSFDTTVSLTYDALYELGSSLTTIAGNYDDFGQVFSISSDGTIFEQDVTTGCIVSGQVTVIDPQYNAYEVSLSFTGCLGINAILNGATFTGLGIYDDTVNPNEIIFGLTGAVQGVTYSLVVNLAVI